jgi:adenylate cyclase
MSFFAELKRRKVIRATVTYVIVAWLVMQIAETVFEPLGLPPWSLTLVITLALLGLPLTIVMAWAFDLTSRGFEAARPDPAAVPDSDDGTPAIAVLPFIDMSPDHDNEYFADGMTEELLNVLAKAGGIRVASRTSSFAFKGKNSDIKTVSQKLNVGHIVEGSVRKSGNRLRITAQLIEAATDSHLWSETYDRDLDDIFAIQDDIAGEIGRVLRCTLNPGDMPGAACSNCEAYDVYLRGRSFLYRGGLTDVAHAVALFNRATEIDPDFARAWEDLAVAYAQQAIYFEGGEAERDAAENASQKAIALAPNSGSTHAAGGMAHLASKRYEEAATEFELAIALDPTLGRAHYNYARAKFHQGDFDKALELFEKATEVDPDDFESPLLATPIYQRLGRLEEANDAARQGVLRAERHLADYPDSQRAYYLGANGLLHLGQRDRAFNWAEKSLAIDPSDPAIRYNMGCFYAQAGEIDKAFECLEDSITSQTWVENDLDLEPLRDDPRYQELLKSLE